MADLTGHSLGRYQLIERLGEGGMATVYKAYDTRLETEVAVKVIRTERLSPELLQRSLKRFEREAKSLARLTHPNIVKVMDYGEHEGMPYLVMPYLPGGTLKERLGRPIPWQEALRILLPIARALDFAHRQNMIHRDVKPSNILITADGDPMLTDFGIAKILDLEETSDLTGTGMGIGTPEYMAPEQWTGKASTQSDQYALGVVLYEMLTGRRPYSADTPAAILIKVTTEPLPRPRQYVHDLPDKVEKLLLNALAKNPADRYASMADLASVMESLPGKTTALFNEQTAYDNQLTEGTLIAVEQELGEPTLKEQFVPQAHFEQDSLPAPSSGLRRYWPALLAVLVILLIVALKSDWFRVDLTSATEAPPAIATEAPLSIVTEAPVEEATQESTPVPPVTEAPVVTAVPTPMGGGGRIAFTRSLSETDWEIFTINPDGSDERQLTTGGHTAAFPAWSPDGKKIAFTSVRDGDNEIFTMNVDGSGLTQLTHDNSDYGQTPKWYPDGNRLVFSFQCTYSSRSCIFSMDSNGGKIFQISKDDKEYDPAISPDGSTLAYGSYGAQGIGLMLMDFQTGEVKLLVDQGSIGDPAWSPDGTRIAYSVRATGQSDIFVVNVSDGAVTQITNTPYDEDHPFWSPDGKLIVYHSAQFGGNEICIMTSDGTFVLRLTTNDTLDYQPAWSWAW